MPAPPDRLRRPVRLGFLNNQSTEETEMLAVVAQIKVKPGAEVQFEKIAAELAAASRQEEGCVEYDLWRSLCVCGEVSRFRCGRRASKIGALPNDWQSDGRAHGWSADRAAADCDLISEEPERRVDALGLSTCPFISSMWKGRNWPARAPSPARHLVTLRFALPFQARRPLRFRGSVLCFRAWYAREAVGRPADSSYVGRSAMLWSAGLNAFRRQNRPGR